MTGQARHVGHATLELLVEPYSVPILRALMDGPRSPSDLERRLPDVPHSAIMRRLAALRTHGLASHQRHNGLPPTAEYSLTATGRMILDVTRAAEQCERRWSGGSSGGLKALRLIRDERTREILLALAEGPSSASDLLREVQLTRSPLRRRLADLAGAGVLAHDTAGATYDLTDSARDVMLVAVAAARWEWESATPQRPPAARNVARIVRMYGPTAQLAADLRGVCRLHVDDEHSGPVVHLAAEGRRVALADGAAHIEPAATCRASATAWCHGLLLHDWSGVRSTGDRALMAALLVSISAALAA